MTIFSLVYFKEQICGLFKAIINKITFKKTSLSYTKKDLLKHPIFRNLEYWLNTGIDAIKLKIAELDNKIVEQERLKLDAINSRDEIKTKLKLVFVASCHS